MLSVPTAGRCFRFSAGPVGLARGDKMILTGSSAKCARPDSRAPAELGAKSTANTNNSEFRYKGEKMEPTLEEELADLEALFARHPCFPEWGQHEGCLKLCAIGGLCKQASEDIALSGKP